MEISSTGPACYIRNANKYLLVSNIIFLIKPLYNTVNIPMASNVPAEQLLPLATSLLTFLAFLGVKF